MPQDRALENPATKLRLNGSEVESTLEYADVATGQHYRIHTVIRDWRLTGKHLYNVDILAREGASQVCVRVRAIVLLPSTQWGSGTVLSSCRKLRRSPKDRNAAGVTTRFRRSLDWKETFCRLLVWRYATVKGHPSTMGSAGHYRIRPMVHDAESHSLHVTHMPCYGRMAELHPQCQDCNLVSVKALWRCFW